MKKLKFSCADFSFPLLPHEKSLQLIKLLGIDAVDLGIFEDRSHLYPSEIAKDLLGHAKHLKNTLESIGLETADVFLQTGADPTIAAANTPDIDIQACNREWFKATLDFAKALGCTHITGLPGVIHGGESYEADWERATKEAQWRIQTSKDKGMIYAIEAHVGSLLPDAKTTLKFIEDTPEITLTLDYGHFIYQGQTNESVHSLIPHASHFHARGGAKGMLQTTVKDNQIDFKTITTKLREVAYPGKICMEYVHVDWEGCNKTDNVSETIRLVELIEGFQQSEI